MDSKVISDLPCPPPQVNRINGALPINTGTTCATHAGLGILFNTPRECVRSPLAHHLGHMSR